MWGKYHISPTLFRLKLSKNSTIGHLSNNYSQYHNSWICKTNSLIRVTIFKSTIIIIITILSINCLQNVTLTLHNNRSCPSLNPS
jgi:hypothetical protein